MTEEDRRWKDAVDAANGRKPPRRPGAGRPCERFLVMEPCPVHNTHVIVMKCKLKIPALKGNPPPTEPPSRVADDSAAAERQRQRFAEYFCANHIPWSAAAAQASADAGKGMLDLSYDRWHKYRKQLHYDACFERAREADNDQRGKDKRLIAAGRHVQIERILQGFKTREQTAKLCNRHRERFRFLFNPGEGPPRTRVVRDHEWMPAERLMRRKLCSVREAHDLIKKAEDKLEWRNDLLQALPSKHETTSTQNRETLAKDWGVAANAGPIVKPTIAQVAEMRKQLEAPLQQVLLPPPSRNSPPHFIYTPHLIVISPKLRPRRWWCRRAGPSIRRPSTSMLAATRRAPTTTRSHRSPRLSGRMRRRGTGRRTARRRTRRSTPSSAQLAAAS